VALEREEHSRKTHSRSDTVHVRTDRETAGSAFAHDVLHKYRMVLQEHYAMASVQEFDYEY
jgi:hypothetical protein